MAKKKRDSFTEEELQKMYQLAPDMIGLARIALTVRLRYMDAVITRLDLKEIETEEIMTDGEYFYYDPINVVELYLKDAKDTKFLNRAYFHSLLHCLFKHMFVKILENERLWDLACDIAVENCINDLELDELETGIKRDQDGDLKNFKSKVNRFTAEWIYSYLLKEDLDETEIIRLEKIFSQDSHTVWYHKTYAGSVQKLGSGGDNGDGDDSGNGNGKSQDSGNRDNQDPDQDETMFNEYWEKSREEARKKELEERWDNISRRVQTALESFEKSKGNIPGFLVANLGEVTKERYSYESFLKQFAMVGEAVKINPDEFDFIYYTYGLNRYGNMPLIEPLEYREVKMIKELVIAIDTSYSTATVAKSFITKTYSILKSTESFFTKFHIRVIQCDTRITEEATLTNQEEVDNYVKNYKVKGYGGTAFMPVFNRVDTLIKEREFRNLKGLIYFTDCEVLQSDYPQKPTPYKTAFVVVDEGYDIPPVPSWATQIIVKKEEL